MSRCILEKSLTTTSSIWVLSKFSFWFGFSWMFWSVSRFIISRTSSYNSFPFSFSDFSEFFASDGRKEVLNYLKSGDVSLNRDGLNNISNIIRTVEKAAIDRYLQKIEHEKNLRTSNETAKQRLTAPAQNGPMPEKPTSDSTVSEHYLLPRAGKWAIPMVSWWFYLRKIWLIRALLLKR